MPHAETNVAILLQSVTVDDIENDGIEGIRTSIIHALPAKSITAKLNADNTLNIVGTFILESPLSSVLVAPSVLETSPRDHPQVSFSFKTVDNTENDGIEGL